MELVEDSETGILVENINEDNLRHAINDLYNNQELINTMSKNCIEKREKMISLEQYCEKVLEIYNQTIEK